MNLEDKITSLEDALKVREIRGALYDGDTETTYFRLPVSYLQPSVLTARVTSLDGSHQASNYQPKSRWWFVREYYRFQKNQEVYGEVLGYLWTYPHTVYWCPKPHLADLTKIEFYPDAVAAAAERPIVTSMAKFLRRACPIYSDEYIRDVDAAYRASMSNEVEILYGAELIRGAYLSGPTSCMAHKFHTRKSDYEDYDGMHPVDAYDVPGIGIAVGRNGAGEVNARSIVYINPKDEKDKRAVRVYGDSTLANRLKRAGFSFKSLRGVGIKAQPNPKLIRSTGASGEPEKVIEQGYMAYVAPYLDGPEGNHTSSEAARHLVKFAGSDELICLPQKVVTRLRQRATELGVTFTQVMDPTPGATGVVLLKELPVEARTLTCAVTGRVFDLTVEDIGEMMSVWKDGKVQQAIASSTTKRLFPEYCSMVSIGIHLFYNKDEPPPMFKPATSSYMSFDGEGERRRHGYKRMDPEMYPDRHSEWIHGYEDDAAAKYVGVTRDGLEYWALKTDVVRCIVNLNGGYQIDYVVTSRLPELTRVHSINAGVPLYAEPSVETAKTITGRTVVHGIHEITNIGTATEPRWAFTRTVDNIGYFGSHTIYYVKGELPVVPEETHEYAVRQMLTWLDTPARWDTANMDTMIWNTVFSGGGSPHISRAVREGAKSIEWGGYHQPPLSDSLELIRTILASPTMREIEKVRLRWMLRMQKDLRKAHWARYVLRQNSRGLTVPAAEPVWMDLGLEPEAPPEVVPATPVEALAEPPTARRPRRATADEAVNPIPYVMTPQEEAQHERAIRQLTAGGQITAAHMAAGAVRRSAPYLDPHAVAIEDLEDL